MVFIKPNYLSHHILICSSGKVLDTLQILSVVPQGIVLGLLFHLLCTLNISTTITTPTEIYPDHTEILVSLNSLQIWIYY